MPSRTVSDASPRPVSSETAQGIAEVLPAIRARRQEIEQARQLPLDLVEQLRRTGVFRLGVPRVFGGLEATPLELMAATEAVAAADGSTGWCTMVGIANNLSAGYINEQGAREVWPDPTAPTAGIAAPAGTAVRVEGGVRVNGRWPYASGITHSSWVWAGCMVVEKSKPQNSAAGPEIIHVCMPVSDVEIHDTWFVSGLCGTGSQDFSAQDVFVPEHRIFKLLDPTGHRPEPLYQMPPLALFVFQLVSVSLGIARAALDELIELAQTKVPSLYHTVLADRPVAQVEIARAEASLRGARAFLHDTVADMWRTVSAGRDPSRHQVALARIATMKAMETGAAVTRIANTLAGGSSIYTTSSLQRHARDAEAITHHFTVAPHTWEEAGRVLLGREPSVPVF
jgi:alkylation response protein AidB-like acyl-CoA dehydrogenase